MVFVDKAEELAVAVVDDVGDLLLERERRELLEFEAVALSFEHVDPILNLVSLLDFTLNILVQE